MHFEKIISLLVLFSVLFLNGCATSAPDSETSKRGLLRSDFPTWLNFDVSNHLKENPLLRDHPDSLTVLIRDYLEEKGKQGQLSTRDSLEILKFKALVLSVAGRYDTSTVLLLELFEKARIIQDTQFIITALADNILFSFAEYITTPFDPFIDMGLHYFKNKPDSPQKAAMKYRKADLLLNKQDYDNAHRLLKDALDQFIRDQDDLQIALVATSLGNLFSAIESHDESARYSKLAIKHARLAEKEDTEFMALNNLGIYYKNKNDLDSALLCYQTILKSLFFVQDPSKRNSYLPTLLNLSNIYQHKGEYALSITGFREVQQVSREIKLWHGLALGLISEGNVYLLTNKPEKALALFDEAVKLVEKEGMDYLYPEIWERQEKALIATGNYKRAYHISQKNKRLKDSIFALEKLKAIHEKEILYESNLKEVRNEYLSKSLKEKEKQLQFRNWMLGCISILILILLYLFLYKSKLNKELQLAHKVLMTRYKEERKKLTALRDQLDGFDGQGQKLLSRGQQNLEIMNSLRSFFTTTEPFLNPKLRISDVSQALNLQAPEVSTALRSNGYANFSNFVNEFRVEKVKKMLEDPKYNQFTISSIGEFAGFGSKQGFYNVFETYTGVKPGYYRKHITE